MRHKALKSRREPLNLSDALITFGLLKDDVTLAVEAAKLGQRLVREIQYLHGIIDEVRDTLPDTYNDYFDPARLDSALARTKVRP